MEKLTLSFVKNERKVSKKGNSYVSTSLQFVEYPGVYYNGFGDENTLNWNKGEQVEVELYEEEYNGKMQQKFKLPKRPRGGGVDLSGLFEQLERMEKKIDQMYSVVVAKKVPAQEPVASAEPTAPDKEDLPF